MYSENIRACFVLPSLWLKIPGVSRKGTMTARRSVLSVAGKRLAISRFESKTGGRNTLGIFADVRRQNTSKEIIPRYTCRGVDGGVI